MLVSVIKKIVPKQSRNKLLKLRDDLLLELYRYVNHKKYKVVKQIRPYSMVGVKGLLATYDISKKLCSNKINGCFVECGVARGGCLALINSVSGRDTWGFDTFEGLPEPSKEDKRVDEPKSDNRGDAILRQGYCLGTFDEVLKLLNYLECKDFHLVQGLFKQTLYRYKFIVGEIAFLRIDADWYNSTRQCLVSLYDNVVNGGYIYIDDYHLEGCKKAVDEYLESVGFKPKIKYDGRGGIYFKKERR